MPSAIPSFVATKSNVNSSDASVELLAANNARKGVIIHNDSTAILYVSYGTVTASATSYTYELAAGDHLEMAPDPVFLGQILGIWSAVNGAARITELT